MQRCVFKSAIQNTRRRIHAVSFSAFWSVTVSLRLVPMASYGENVQNRPVKVNPAVNQMNLV